MKTKLVRPLLVKSKEYVDKYPFLGIDNGKLSIYSERNPSNFNVVIYQLILISLDPNEKIEIGDKYLDLLSHRVYVCEGDEYLNHTDERKVITTQDQLSPELINTLVAEYNAGGMQDFEIEMEIDIVDIPFCPHKPKLTNGFVTVVEKPKVNVPIVYTDDEVNLLFHKYLDDHSILNTHRNHAIMDVWFNENKKK